MFSRKIRHVVIRSGSVRWISIRFDADRINLVAPASPVHRDRYSTTGTEKVDPARKFKCTTAARVHSTMCITKKFGEQNLFTTKMLKKRSNVSWFKVIQKKNP